MELDRTRALLALGIDQAQQTILTNLNRTLYGDFTPSKPLPWWRRKIRWARQRLGEKIADLASWVAGYDVRGDW